MGSGMPILSSGSLTFGLRDANLGLRDASFGFTELKFGVPEPKSMIPEPKFVIPEPKFGVPESKIGIPGSQVWPPEPQLRISNQLSETLSSKRFAMSVFAMFVRPLHETRWSTSRKPSNNR